MKAPSHCALASPRLSCAQVPATRSLPGLVDDARAGLLERPRSMPPKYFYDRRGSVLFDAICDTPEYYPTRTEEALLRRHAAEIVALARPDHILELGSGAARKTRHLFDACQVQSCDCRYWPFDVCAPMLLDSGRELTEDYPWLSVNALVGDWLGGLEGLPRLEGRCLYLFLGGTIGNFSPRQARSFLQELGACMNAGDWLLLGADRVKDPAVLHAAYNDAAGITAEFNLNLLRVLNRELDADFDLDGFAHRAYFAAARSQIEMHLVARRRQHVHLGALARDIDFTDGETILTEISRKFTPEALGELMAAAGVRVARHLQPENGYYSLVLARRD